MNVRDRYAMTPAKCRVCSCSQNDACWSPTTGGCYWVEVDLCSARDCGGQQRDCTRDHVTAFECKPVD